MLWDITANTDRISCSIDFLIAVKTHLSFNSLPMKLGMHRVQQSIVLYNAECYIVYLLLVVVSLIMAPPIVAQPVVRFSLSLTGHSEAKEKSPVGVGVSADYREHDSASLGWCVNIQRSMSYESQWAFGDVGVKWYYFLQRLYLVGGVGTSLAEPSFLYVPIGAGMQFRPRDALKPFAEVNWYVLTDAKAKNIYSGSSIFMIKAGITFTVPTR